MALLAAAALAGVLLALALAGSSGKPGAIASSPSVGAGFVGAALPAGAPVRGFTLTDQRGHRVSLAAEGSSC